MACFRGAKGRCTDYLVKSQKETAKEENCMGDLSEIARSIADPNCNVKAAVNLAIKLKYDLIREMLNLERFRTSHVDVVAMLTNSEVKTTKFEMVSALNLEHAWNFLLSNLEYNDCWMLLSQLHKIVARDLDRNCGELRKEKERVIGTSYTAPVPYIDSVHEKIWRFRDISNPVDKALWFYLWLIESRLFSSKNYSVAVLMANKILIQAGVGVISVPVELRNEYQTFMIQYFETGDSSELYKFLKDNCIAYA